MRVVMGDHAGEALSAAAATIHDAIAYVVDVSDRAAMSEFADAVVGKHGLVSVLMNNAGVGSGGNVFADPAAWDAVIGINLLGVLKRGPELRAGYA